MRFREVCLQVGRQDVGNAEGLVADMAGVVALIRVGQHVPLRFEFDKLAAYFTDRVALISLSIIIVVLVVRVPVGLPEAIQILQILLENKYRIHHGTRITVEFCLIVRWL